MSDQGSSKRTILHGFDPLLPSPLPSSARKTVRPEVPARPLPRNQESRGRWTVGCSWRRTRHSRYESLATAAESTSDLIRGMCKDGTFEVGLICRWRTIRVLYQARLRSHLPVKWILFWIADPLEQGRFASIRPPDNEDAEVGVLGSEFCSFFWVGCQIGWRQRRFRSKHFLQAGEKTFGLDDLRWVSVSHIDESRPRVFVYKARQTELCALQ